jgi:hypothetical protein
MTRALACHAFYRLADYHSAPMRTLILIALLLPLPALAQYGPSQYRIERWDEDYSSLADPAYRSDPFDRLKYIPLGLDDSYLSLGGQARYRYDYFNNLNFDKGPQDENGFHLVRLLTHADAHFGRNLRGFVQLDSSMIDNREGGPRNGDVDEIDVQQSFFDARFDLGSQRSFTLRAGRQELIYGAQRLISPDDWGNVRRTFEGARLSFSIPNDTLDVFWVRPVKIDKERLNNGDGDISFAGICNVTALPAVLPSADSRLDLYLLALNRSANAARPVDSDTYTLGARFHTNPKPWDMDIEGDWQFGNLGDRSISAWSLASEIGYTFDHLSMTPRTWIGLDVASGSADGDHTFNQLFPPQYLYLGHIYVLARENVIDAHGGLSLNLTPAITLSAEQHLFWRQNTDAPLFNIKGDLFRADPNSDAAAIGDEIDFWMTWQIQRHVSAYIGYAHFFAGSFISDADAGQDRDIDFFYGSVTFTF